MTSSPASATMPRPTVPPLTPPTPSSTIAPGDTLVAHSLEATGFRFATGPTHQTQTQWIDAARLSYNPQTRAQYDALVRLTGGRTDNAAIGQVMDRYYALSNARTASEVASAEKGWFDQISDTLNAWDPTNALIDMAQPGIAAAVRQSGIGQTEWGGHLQKILDTPGSAVAFRNGLRTGVINGAKDMVVSLAGMVGKTVQYSADKGVLGDMGDALRGVTGGLPGWADAIIPSDERGARTDGTLQAMGSAVSAYLHNRSAAQVGADALALIGKQWDGLKASHAAAAAKGPEAEAQWWGEVTGRTVFEVASTFVPVAGQVGKAGKVAKAGDAIADSVRAGDKAGDVIRSTGKLADDVPLSAAAAAARTVTRHEGANTVTWTLDAQERLISAKASLAEVFKGLSRSPDEVAAQAATAAKGIKGDHGGHAVPHRFLNDQGAINMFPQNGVPDGALKNFNGSAFKTLENELADWVEAGGRVDYEVKFSNFDAKFPDRPNTVRIEYKVYNEQGVEVYKNRRIFENEAGQTFSRLPKADILSKLTGLAN